MDPSSVLSPVDDTTISGESELDQIRSLLENAERRMQGENPSMATVPSFHHIDHTLPKFRRLKEPRVENPTIVQHQGVARTDASCVQGSSIQRSANYGHKVEDPITQKKRKIQEKQATAGSDWFDLPRPEMNPAMKRDLQLLRMRGALDPKRHYKNESPQSLASGCFQIGTILEGPSEYYSARIPIKDRKRSFADEIMSSETSTGRFKRKYSEIQGSKVRGRKTFYKKLQQARSKGSLKD
ncbi:MAG: dTDP-fucopyranose mutase [Ramalina farinacea]|uniref:dTDP-fucopyranose mutase n=1 Tax=Ramalina farinacea TaxID=258253 RepID=A0AA43TXR2_9LECA|nr:dTDP-fucopyranose mutase [Ramalina farinacea]